MYNIFRSLKKFQIKSRALEIIFFSLSIGIIFTYFLVSFVIEIRRLIISGSINPNGSFTSVSQVNFKLITYRRDGVSVGKNLE